jgi:hypothetical protein
LIFNKTNSVSSVTEIDIFYLLPSGALAILATGPPKLQFLVCKDRAGKVLGQVAME